MFLVQWLLSVNINVMVKQVNIFFEHENKQTSYNLTTSKLLISPTYDTKKKGNRSQCWLKYSTNKVDMETFSYILLCHQCSHIPYIFMSLIIYNYIVFLEGRPTYNISSRIQIFFDHYYILHIAGRTLVV